MAQQIWAVDSLGGYLHSDEFSKQIRHAAQPMMKFVTKLHLIEKL